MHGTVIPRMYGRLTANTPGCVAFSLPCGAGTFDLRRFLRFSSLSRSQRSARPARRDGLEPERRPIPGHSCSRDGFARRYSLISGPQRGPNANPRRALRRHALPSATNKGDIFCRHRVPDGPTLDAPDCIADQNPRKTRFDAERRQLCAPFHSTDIRFGSAFQVAFRPSPHPRIRWTVASPDRALCALGPTRPPPPRVPKCPTKC